MKRRNFLSLSLTVATGMVASRLPAINLVRSRKTSTPVGGNVWVYAKNLPDNNVSPILDQIFSDMKYAGFDGIELMENTLREPATIKIITELIEQFKIPVIGTSYGANMWDESKSNEILEDAENVMGNMARIKARTFGVSVGRPPRRLKTENELDAQAALLKKLITLGEKNGVILNLHNHTYEVENNMYDLRGTLKRIPDVKLGPDLNWLERAGVDPISFLNEFKDNVVFLHLRDQLKNGEWAESLGEGITDFKKIAETLKENKFKGDVVLELAHADGFIPSRPVRESLKMSRDYIRKIMKY